jgi:hypothetical protein
MKKIFTLIVTGVLLSLTFQGCYNDNEYDLYPFVACDSTNVTYSQTIVPIMTGNCNVCHSTTLASGGIVTDTYDGLSVIAKNGRLWGAVSHSQGFQPMPQNTSKLSGCDLGKIKVWINAGVPNN